jgi:transposase
MADSETDVVGGVDTHKDSHTVAALGGTGRLLGTAQFPTTLDGYHELVVWLRGLAASCA